MAEPPYPRRIVSFANFEVDLYAGELRRAGMRLKLTGQPFQVLGMLLEHPGEVVTREELEKRLWPDTFVDVDHSLNTAINKIREALGDSAENPRFVETLARRGYRFIGAVNQPTPAPPEVTATVEEEKKGVTPGNESDRKLWRLAFGAVALVAVLAGAYYFLRPLPPPRVLKYRQLTNDHKQKGINPCGWGSLLVTDGPRILFSDASSSLVQVASAGGDTSAISTPFKCFRIFDISPDKTELLGTEEAVGYAPDQPLWILSVASGLAQRIGGLSGHEGSWSPDGQRIAYARGNSVEGPNELCIAGKDGHDVRKLAGFEHGGLGRVRWGPDGKVLRMLVVGEIRTEVWEVSADGTNLHPIVLPGETRRPESINWTPDGRYFVFSNDNMDGSNSVWTVRQTQGLFAKIPRPVQVTMGATSFWMPTPSLDGKQLYAVGGKHRGELDRYDASSRTLRPFLSGVSAEQLDFSRDGQWVAYVTFPEGILWRSRVDGSERMQLTSSVWHAAVPRWAPDGSRIAFSAIRAVGTLSAVPALGGPWGIYLVSATGGEPESVFATERSGLDATWSPDGNSLIFNNRVNAREPKVYSLDLRTRRVSDIPGSEGLYSARMSPDGRFILTMDALSEHKLMLFNVEKQNWSQLFEVAHGGLGWPQWSSDSKYVYVRDAVDTRAPVIYRIRIADGKPERVATIQVPDGLTGWWNGWAGVAPDGSPILLRDLSIQEIYALDVDLP